MFSEAFLTVISLWGKLDIVCNNAGVVDEDDWNKTLNINLVSCYVMLNGQHTSHEIKAEGVGGDFYTKCKGGEKKDHALE